LGFGPKLKNFTLNTHLKPTCHAQNQQTIQTMIGPKSYLKFNLADFTFFQQTKIEFGDFFGFAPKLKYFTLNAHLKLMCHAQNQQTMVGPKSYLKFNLADFTFFWQTKIEFGDFWGFGPKLKTFHFEHTFDAFLSRPKPADHCWPGIIPKINLTDFTFLFVSKVNMFYFRHIFWPNLSCRSTGEVRRRTDGFTLVARPDGVGQGRSAPASRRFHFGRTPCRGRGRAGSNNPVASGLFEPTPG
jgi:hypothetical protein